MPISINESVISLEELVNRIFSSRKITRTDQQKLMSLLLSKDTLSVEEHSYIDQVFDRLRKGLIHVAD